HPAPVALETRTRGRGRDTRLARGPGSLLERDPDATPLELAEQSVDDRSGHDRLRALETARCDLAAGNEPADHRGREAGRTSHRREAIGPSVHHLGARAARPSLSSADRFDAEEREVVLAGLETDARMEERVENALGHYRGAVDLHGRLSEETELS